MSVITPGAPGFMVTLCQLVPISPCLDKMGYYLCPSSSPGRSHCNYPGHYYCAYWGCENIASDWSPGGGTDQFLTVRWGPYGCQLPSLDGSGGTVELGNCSFLYINITKPDDPGWVIGKTWEIRYREPGADRGGIIMIKKESAPSSPEPVGPNHVISGVLESGEVNITATNRLGKVDMTTAGNATQSLEKGISLLWDLIQASYQVLNATNPNITRLCWLCYDIRPPFYEAIGVTSKASRINGSNPGQCLWNQDKTRQGITVSQVSGRERCIGKVPREKEHLCGNWTKITERKPADWLVLANNTKWVCSNLGLTPCVSLKLFNTSRDYCIQVAIVPRIIYHPEDFVYDYQMVPDHYLQKREPLTALTIATLMAIGAAGAGTGITTLVQQNQKF